MSITDEMVAELEALAGKATPGPWSSERDQVGPRSQEDDQSYGMLIPVAYIERFDWPENAEANKALIATANPATILALLSERAELKRDAERLAWLFTAPRSLDVWRASVDKAMQDDK
jgi:hypothetical protein